MTYANTELTRAQVDALRGHVVIDFGANWCGHCQAAETVINSALEGQNNLQHLKVEDGKGRALGRSFAVKLWPTLIFLRDGQEIGRLVRPNATSDIQSLLRLL